MRIHFLIWATVFILIGVVFSGTIRSYLTFLPQY